METTPRIESWTANQQHMYEGMKMCEMPEELCIEAANAIENCSQTYLDKKLPSSRLWGGFCWTNNSKGHGYWIKIVKQLEEKEKMWTLVL